MKTIIHLIFFLLLGTSSFAEEKVSIFDQNFNDYSENLEDAIDAKKDGIFIFFHMEECPFCQKMRRHVLNRKPIIDYFKKHFLNFEVDVESSLDLIDFNGDTLPEKIFAKHHNKIGATPVLAFFDLKGNRVVRHTGFANEKDFLLLAKYFVEGAYKNEKFIRYKRKHR
ncbi:thioredoxin family protein [Bathymodiolus septemdierum thioautotrophic gill symbiont]|uniref:Thioredoxin n=1 Tax=endosymbiont of Bathymodiolus septemdierum str. Myojin knoll TaxID=1303921 RepID=A0A0P0USQ4_9GAMM|nr:thioredoxin fold domain-containing protein [Bathymodiolus septemdierum thioautotrophic gill symbiont]BAS68131.1 thioredoxin [endosymbiont of Bathymodiolus septemdierum str. Myojin knoll]